MNKKIRQGKSYEKIIIGNLLGAGFDVYETVADDQGIDGIIRIEKEGKVKYYDFQSKGSKNFAGVRCKTSKLNPNLILIIYSSTSNEMLWLRYQDANKFFPKTGSEWGDIFIKKEHINELKKLGHFDLYKLKEKLL